MISWSTVGSTVPCAVRLGADRDRLAAALRHVTLHRAQRPARAKVAQLDADILEWLDRGMADLSPGQRDNLVSVLERATPVVGVETPAGPTSEILGAAEGCLLTTPDGLELQLDAMGSETEWYRYVLFHELAHLRRFAADGPASESSARARHLFTRPLGVYREELHAARASYRYLRRNYRPADVVRLEQIVARSARVEARAAAVGVLRRTAEGAEVDMDRVGDLNAWAQLRDIVLIDTSDKLLRLVRRAWESSETEFIKWHARYYRSQQRHAHRIVVLKRLQRKLARLIPGSDHLSELGVHWLSSR